MEKKNRGLSPKTSNSKARLQRRVADAYKAWARHGDQECFVAMYQAGIGALSNSLRASNCILPTGYVGRVLGVKLGEDWECDLTSFLTWHTPELALQQATLDAMQAMHDAWRTMQGARFLKECGGGSDKLSILPFALLGWDPIASEYFELLQPIIWDLNKSLREEIVREAYRKRTRKFLETERVLSEDDMRRLIGSKSCFSVIADEATVKQLTSERTVGQFLPYACAVAQDYWRTRAQRIQDVKDGKLQCARNRRPLTMEESKPTPEEVAEKPKTPIRARGTVRSGAQGLSSWQEAAKRHQKKAAMVCSG